MIDVYRLAFMNEKRICEERAKPQKKLYYYYYYSSKYCL